ncbi:MAG: hypothetical protein PQJ50_12840, partial [Spirochaetales bacterium]|nr:hypothetical protein [Spirochaetales bacterium]
GDINKPLGSGRMGASLIYHPYLLHNMWSEEESSSHWSSDRIFTFGNVDQRGIYEINYFLIDLYWGDLTGEKDWVYKTELTLGSNLADPVGYLGYQGGKNRSEFFGGDLMLGRVIGGEKFSWVPSVNCTGYMASIEEPNIGSIEVRAGNRWCWNESLTVFLDAGLVIKNYNQQKESGETLMTGIDGILNIKAQYSF